MGGALSNREARWLAIEAQGLGAARPKPPVGRRHIHTLIGKIGTLQLDAINVLERTQFVVLFSRLGGYRVDDLHRLTGPGGELFEYWGHAASLLPMAAQPLFRWRMAEHAGGAFIGPKHREYWEAWGRVNADYIAAVLEEVRATGPMPASKLSDPRRQDGEWWERRSVGRQALEWLFTNGELAAWRTPNFERVYDVPERVIPPAVLALPTPPVEEAHRALLLAAATSIGVGTLRDLADYYRIKPTRAKARIAELVEAGSLVPVSVEGWPERAYCLPTAWRRAPKRPTATLLSPFDSLIWERSRTTRLFTFDYKIEVYVREPERQYGYYVLPVLLGDELVGRLDLKADRKSSTLRAAAAHVEPGADPGMVAAAAAVELDAMRDWLRLDAVAVADRGNLAKWLKAAV